MNIRGFILLAALSSCFPPINVSADVLFRDDFESYPLGDFPSSGGWQLVYNGAGNSFQYVDDTHAVSDSKSLHLVGSSCWSGVAYHQIENITSKITLEGNIFINQIVTCGCDSDLAMFGLYNPNLGSWGTAFGYALFDCDGNVYSGSFSKPYTAQKWYHIKIEIDLEKRVFNSFIDGSALGTAVPLPASETPSGVYFYAGHGENSTVWFDDIQLYSIPKEISLIPEILLLLLE